MRWKNLVIKRRTIKNNKKLKIIKSYKNIVNLRLYDDFENHHYNIKFNRFFFIIHERKLITLWIINHKKYCVLIKTQFQPNRWKGSERLNSICVSNLKLIKLCTFNQHMLHTNTLSSILPKLNIFKSSLVRFNCHKTVRYPFYFL